MLYASFSMSYVFHARRGALLYRCARKQLHLGVAGKQIEAVGLAAGEQVEVNVVAQRGAGHDRVLPVQLGKLIEGGKGFAVDDRALFNPAHFVFLGSDAEKAAAVVEHLERLAVGHFGDAI